MWKERFRPPRRPLVLPHAVQRAILAAGREECVLLSRSRQSSTLTLLLFSSQPLVHLSSSNRARACGSPLASLRSILASSSMAECSSRTSPDSMGSFFATTRSCRPRTKRCRTSWVSSSSASLCHHRPTFHIVARR